MHFTVKKKKKNFNAIFVKDKFDELGFCYNI